MGSVRANFLEPTIFEDVDHAALAVLSATDELESAVSNALPRGTEVVFAFGQMAPTRGIVSATMVHGTRAVVFLINQKTGKVRKVPVHAIRQVVGRP
ncbi:MAG: hypothetical protein AB7Q81_24550 [Gammaproteobacteria bacterium]